MASSVTATPLADVSTRPVFIMGTQRSGTTLLRLILDSHPNIAVGFESGFMRAVDTIKQLPGWNYGKNWYQRYGMAEDDLNARVRDFYAGIFSDYAASQGKQRWGEKTPDLAHLGEMAAIFPDAQFVCIVRHAGAVAASLMRWDKAFEPSVEYWLQANRRVKCQTPRLGPDRIHVCRYEDLVRQPREVLMPIMDFLDEAWSDDLLRHHEVQAERGTATKVEGGTRSDRPLSTEGIDAWKERLTSEQVAALAARPGRLLGYFGYRAETAVPHGSLPEAAG